jgi:hypothetical protein
MKSEWNAMSCKDQGERVGDLTTIGGAVAWVPLVAGAVKLKSRALGIAATVDAVTGIPGFQGKVASWLYRSGCP